MRLGGRLAAAIDILHDIEKRHRPAADAMRDWGLSHRFAGAGDRAAIGNFVYDGLRRRRAASWLFDADTPRSLVFGGYLLENGGGTEALDSAFTEDRFAPPPLDEAELASLRARLGQPLPDAARANVPEWCEPLAARAFGEVWVEECAALADRPPLDMRANTLKVEKQKVLAALARTGAEAARIATNGMRVPPVAGDGRHPNVQAEPAFRKGWFEVQDEGSQIVAELAGAAPGRQVLDFCAGAGGKTLAMAAMMENRGQIHAYDADRQRLAPIFDRLKRAGCRNVQVIAEDEALARLEGQMDLVIVDAPCTGSGTWRRRPDAKWRLTPQQLEARQIEQMAILDTASRYVKPGGRLAYITCSIFREENVDQARAFIERAPAFHPLDHRAIWQERFPAHPQAAHIEENDGIMLTPAVTGTDGFYFSAFERR
ncbi:RsmB/NOP family class I SAM-dependent RNA methyltransferase [Chelativorans salis]|uniref:RsmB/NOP family class I SAM-dependent RNA methyltransferase n=1 Tax=Chelativorans salis TaxID=2978478 RepID=A0ABT2LGY5_9HYPH|nr:RsmB/NOP family class I SAM-dependent RNA methyltransferase [Chelativorans sp. EGI FJ00035]MCT7373792.1 RsmB/NOP family class I SAM-dependent RNA methyltransferase [Chelativorans sp. EGI FJ00035]